MQLKFVILATFLTVFKIVYATNYCSKSLCGLDTHIACSNTGTFASSCISATLATFTQNTKDLIVNAHNTKRNLVAGGNTALEPACRMATMEWDDELASLAELNVKQCQMKHDACHNTDAFRYSGQNLAWIGFYGSADVASLAERSVNLWYKEIENTKMAYINKYPSNYRGEVDNTTVDHFGCTLNLLIDFTTIGHFTVMVADRNIRVGCAASTYAVSGKPYNAFLFACNYATTNMINFPIYTACKTAASSCTTGTNTKFPSLCSASETYNVNKWY